MELDVEEAQGYAACSGNDDYEQISTKRFFAPERLTMTHYGPARASLGISEIARRRLSNQGKR